MQGQEEECTVAAGEPQVIIDNETRLFLPISSLKDSATSTILHN